MFYYLRTAPHTSEIIPTTTTSGSAIVTSPPIVRAIKTNGRNTSVNNTFAIPHVILNASPINFPKTPIIRQINTNVSISFTLSFSNILKYYLVTQQIFLYSTLLYTFHLIQDKCSSYNITSENLICIRDFLKFYYRFSEMLIFINISLSGNYCFSKLFCCR